MPSSFEKPGNASTVAAMGATPPTDDISSRVAQAYALVQQGRAEEAVSVLDVAISQSPQSLDVWRAKATIHSFQGDADRAQEASDRLIELAPLSTEGWLRKGQILCDEEQPEQALECADRAIMLDPGSVAAHRLRGDSLVKLQRWEDAFEAFATAAKSDPEQFDASDWAAKGDQFQQGGRVELALNAYDRAIEQDRGNAAAWYGRGNALKERNDLQAAIDAFEKASEADEDFIAGFLEAGALCTQHGRYDDALAFFERAKNAKPADSRPWRYIGWTHELRGRFDEARAAFDEATKKDPGDAEAWNALGGNLYNQDRLDEAVSCYQRAIDISQSPWWRYFAGWPHLNLGYVYQKKGRGEDAIREMDRAIELDRTNPEFWKGKLFILSADDKANEAEIDKIAGDALAAVGDDPSLRVEVAGLLADFGKVDRARELLHEIEPSSLTGNLSRLSFAANLLQTGEPRPARDLLQDLESAPLTGSEPVARALFHLIADRFAGAAPLSEELSKGFLRALAEWLRQLEASGRPHDAVSSGWTLRGICRLILRAELPLAEKFLLATLVDLVEAKVRPGDLSFFAESDGWSQIAERRPDPPPAAG